MFRFSCKILASTVTTHINNNVLNILLGHYFSTADAGNFNQAYQWNFKCYSLIQNMVGQVAQPVPPVPAPPRRPVTPPTSTRPRLARRHQGLLLPLHLRMALLAV